MVERLCKKPSKRRKQPPRYIPRRDPRREEMKRLGIEAADPEFCRLLQTSHEARRLEFNSFDKLAGYLARNDLAASCDPRRDGS